MDKKVEMKEKLKKHKSSSKGLNLNVEVLKKYFNQKTFLGILAAGMLVLVVVYVFVYLDFMAKTEEKERTNTELKAQVDILEEYYNHMDEYQAQINEMTDSIQEIMSQYPADAREEDILMLAVQIQQNNAISYNSINMEETEGVYTIPYDLISQTGIEGFDQDIVFRQKHAAYVNITNYDNLKSCIEQIYQSANRIGIDNILYAKNEEDGTLEGNINLYFYSATGTGKEYQAPNIAQYISGTTDLFKSDKVVKKDASKEQVQEAQENTETTVE